MSFIFETRKGSNVCVTFHDMNGLWTIRHTSAKVMDSNLLGILEITTKMTDIGDAKREAVN